MWAVVTCIREIQNRVCQFQMHRVSGNVSHAVDAIRQQEDDPSNRVSRGDADVEKAIAAYSAKLDTIEM